MEKLQGLISAELIPGEDIYCAVASVLFSSDIGKKLITEAAKRAPSLP